MSDIKTELVDRLNIAKARYVAAREEADAATAEIRLMDGLIAKFEELTKDNTRAFPAVPPAQPARRPLNPENLVAAACGNCGQQISRNMPGDRWLHQDACAECPIPGGTSAEPYEPADPAVTLTDLDATPKDGA